MRIGAIIQARMGSTRLPGKVLMDIAGQSMLAHVVERARQTSGADEVLVATTVLPEDDAIVRECAALGVRVFRGSEADVLDRYVQAARVFGLDAIVRITSDCPLLDPEVSTKVVNAFLQEGPDYASNTLVRTYPRGLDTEIVKASVLQRAWRDAGEVYQREHVTPYVYERPDVFTLLPVLRDGAAGGDYGSLRWTVDTVEDLTFVRALQTRLPPGTTGWRAVLDILEEEPELLEINRHVPQKGLKGGTR